MGHWKSELAVLYAKFILRHTWCIKHKTRKHTFFINLFYLRTFSKKKEILFFWVRLALFLLGAYVKSLLLFLKCFLTRQFYEFSFLRCSFSSWHAHFFLNSYPFLYFSIRYVLSTSCTCVLPHYTVIYEDVILTSLRRLLFYTIYHDKAQ